MTIEIRHDTLAHQLLADGTVAHRVELERLAASAEAFAPGAAAALTDWAGSEIARLRAYAVLREAIRARVAEHVPASAARTDYQLIA